MRRKQKNTNKIKSKIKNPCERKLVKHPLCEMRVTNNFAFGDFQPLSLIISSTRLKLWTNSLCLRYRFGLHCQGLSILGAQIPKF